MTTPIPEFPEPFEGVGKEKTADTKPTTEIEVQVEKTNGLEPKYGDGPTEKDTNPKTTSQSTQLHWQGLVCQTCGDKGFTNAFIYCVECLDFAIHRYCLDIIPETVDERVIWYCEDCQVKSTLAQKKKAANLGHITARDPETQRGIDSLATGTKEFNCQDYLPEHAKNIPRKKRTKRKKIAASLAAKKNGDMIQQRKMKFLKDCNLLNWLLREWKFLDEPQTSGRSCERTELVSDSSCGRNESDKANNHEYQAETSSDMSQSVEFEDNKQENYYIYAQPIIDPIWRGSFNIIGTRYDHFEGLVAHISNKACYNVFKEANTLASSLHLEMQPKSVLWPKNFQECEPSDDNIALYFLPGNPMDVEAFDNMVLDMMENGLAMRAATNNAELLIFSSILLPPLFRRVQEKYYLWGVFRGKQNDPISVASHDRSKDSPNEDIDAKQTLAMKRMLNAQSSKSFE
ncbi:hypothetical protein SSX86_003257 [Deinandra increscens subsp. villosa]|uniref:AIPP2-like SPOC-like domain-containing protein n=1 Tax=Deinandra increscens subsp. villosa TaxID=3103831 RepID=A0AAP0H4U2_9ASTR